VNITVFGWKGGGNQRKTQSGQSFLKLNSLIKRVPDSIFINVYEDYLCGAVNEFICVCIVEGVS
jgi:hypothetical protein